MPITALARRLRVDVSLDGSAWQQLLGVIDLNPNINPSITDATTYDGAGWKGNELVLYDWALQIKLLRQPSAGVFPASQELIRLTQGTFGSSARIFTRWYDRNGAPEAWSGLAIPNWTVSKSGVTDLNEVTVDLTGDGTLTPISNPYAAAAVPTILSATPSGVGVGGIVNIYGTGFTGTVAVTGVKFAAVNATSWIVISDSNIVAVMPAGSAGSAAVTVTNGAGASAAFPYTRT